MGENEVAGSGGEMRIPPPLGAFNLEHLNEIIRLCRENDIAELKIKQRGQSIYIKRQGATPPVEYVVAGPAPAQVAVPVPVAPPSAAYAASTPVETWTDDLPRVTPPRCWRDCSGDGRTLYAKLVACGRPQRAPHRIPGPVLRLAWRTAPGTLVTLNFPNRRMRTRMSGGAGGE